MESLSTQKFMVGVVSKGILKGLNNMPKLYDPHVYEPIDTNLLFFLAFACCLAVDIQTHSLIDPVRTFTLCMYVLSYPILAMAIAFVRMCERRQFIESFYPESFWEA